MKNILKKIVNKKVYSWLRWNYHTFGINHAIKSLFIYYSRKSDYIKVQIINTNHFINIRPGTTDQDVYNEIFKENELDFEFKNARVIVDGGAHVGCASIWLSIKYPNSKIYAIEPDEENYKLLVTNSKLFPNIIPLKYGLWSKKTYLLVDNKNKDNWNFTVSEVEFNSGLEGIGITDLMEMFDIKKIDILKIDIEGSEVELFKNSLWINKVEFIIIELHDRFKAGCSDTFFNSISKREYIMEQKGEKIEVRFI